MTGARDCRRCGAKGDGAVQCRHCGRLLCIPCEAIEGATSAANHEAAAHTHLRCTDCGNSLKREEMVQGRFPSYVRPAAGASRHTFYGEKFLEDNRPRDPLCRRCWKDAVATLEAVRA